MNKTRSSLVAAAVLTSAMAAASLGAVLAQQSSPTDLQVCTAALAQCSNQLRSCQAGGGGDPKPGGGGGFTWREADQKDVRLLLGRTIQTEHLDYASLSAATRGVLGEKKANVVVDPQTYVQALHDVATQIRHKEALEIAPQAQPESAPRLETMNKPAVGTH